MKKIIVSIMIVCFITLNAKAQYPSDTLITWSLVNDTSPTYINKQLKAKGERFGNQLNNISYTNGYQKIAPPSGGWTVNIDTTATAGVYIDFPFGLVANYNIGYGCTFLSPNNIILSGYTDAANDSIKITPYLYDSSLYVDSSIFCFWDTLNVHPFTYSCGGGIGYDYYKYINGYWYYFQFNFSQFKYDSSIITNYYQQLYEQIYPVKVATIKGNEFYISSNSASSPNNIFNNINYYNNIDNERLLFLRLYISSSNPNANLYLKQLNVKGGFFGLLPILFSNFTALKKNDKVQLNWSLENEINIDRYVVEKANKNDVFETMKTVLSNKNNDYATVDETPNKGANTYRIKAIAKDGKAKYSSIVKVLFDDKNTSIVIYPNPVKNILSVQLISTKTEKAIVQITDLQGKILQQKEQQLQIGTNAFSINTSSIAKGIYTISIKGSTNQIAKFIKE